MNVLSEVQRIRKTHQLSLRDVHGKEAQVETVREMLDRFGAQLEELSHQEVLHQKVLLTFKEISDQRTAEGKEILENVLNWALSNIPLEQRYEAQLQESMRGTKKEMSIILRDLDTGHIRNLKNQSGTALVQIISFLMNVIVIILSGSSRTMVLDECFSGLQDQETITMMGEILVALSRNENFQFIMVEHKSELGTVAGIRQIRASLTEYEQGVVYAG